MTERTIKIKGLIHDEVCMGTYGLVELELLEIEKEMEALRQLAVINRRELLIDFLDWREKQCDETVDREWVDEYLDKDKIN